MSRKLLLFFSSILLCVILTVTWGKQTPTASFDADYAETGVPLGVSLFGYPKGTQFHYDWYVGDTLVASGQDHYTPAAEDLEQFITVTITPSGAYNSVTLSTYFSRLPVLYLSVEEEIDRDVYRSGTLHIQGNSLYSEEEFLYSGEIQLRGRGNSTWEAYPKKPYKLKLNQASNLFGMGNNKHWVLFANYADESLMRNKIAYDLSGAFGMPYMESTWVTLIYNGQYAGNYVLSEQIRIDDDRVNITDLSKYAKTVAKAMVKADIFPKEKQDALESTLELNLDWLSTGIFTFDGHSYDLTPYVLLPELTGGFLMEIDGYMDEASQFYAAHQPMMFQNPEAAYTNSQLMNYAKEYFVAAFSAMQNGENFYALYQDHPVSYTELFDITSMAQYVLIQEIFFNYDAAQKSNYLYKDIGAKAYMGPIWDMDWSSGRTHTYRSLEQWWSVYYTHDAVETLWYSGVIQDPYFLSVLKEVWDTNRDSILSLTTDDGTLAQSYQYIYESAMANTELWAFEYGFEASYETFFSWMTQRIQWLDAQFTDLNTLVDSFDQYHRDPNVQILRSSDGIQVSSPTGTYAVLYYNGIRLSQRQLTDQTASWSAEEYSYTSDSDVIMVRVYNESGTLLGSNYTDLRD